MPFYSTNYAVTTQCILDMFSPEQFQIPVNWVELYKGPFNRKWDQVQDRLKAITDIYKESNMPYTFVLNSLIQAKTDDVNDADAFGYLVFNR